MRRRGRRLVLCGLAWVCAVLVAPSAAGATEFSAPQQISGSCPDSSGLQIAMDAAGDELAVWDCTEPSGGPIYVQEAASAAGGSWSPAVTIGSTNSPGPGTAIAIDGEGQGLVVWSYGEYPTYQTSEIEAAVVAPDGSIANQTVLSQPELFSRYPHVALNAAGDAVVTWEAWENIESETSAGAAPYAARGTLSNGFQAAQQLESYGRLRMEYPAVAAIDPGGDAAVAWERQSGPLNSAVSVAGEPFTATGRVPADGTVTGNPRIAIDGNGNVTVAWNDWAWNGAEWKVKLDAASEPLTGGFGPLQRLSPQFQAIGSSALASDAAGDTVVAWSGSVGAGWVVEEADSVANSSGFQPPVQIAEPVGPGMPISASMSPDGVPSVSWSEETSPEHEEFTSFVATGDPVVTRLPKGAVAPVLASDAAGDLSVAWIQATAFGHAVFVSDTGSSGAGECTSALGIETSGLPTATRGAAYTAELKSCGGVAPYKWSKVVKLPKGLKLSGLGTIQGTPSTKLASGTYHITVKLSDAEKPKRSVIKDLTLEVG